MLAVTEVNGCEVCSYAHTHMALKQGFSKEEIGSLLSASDAYHALVRAYGLPRSRTIIAAIQVMMVGNTSGLPMSALYRRLQGKAYTNSSVGYEAGMLASNLLLVPLSFVHATLRLLLAIASYLTIRRTAPTL